MQLVIAEPLGVAYPLIAQLIKDKLGTIDVKYYPTVAADDDEYIERIKDAEILIIANHPLKAKVIAAAAKLKLISVAFTGVDHVALKAAKQKGIVVTNAAGYATAAVSELVFGLIINLYRKLKANDAAIRARRKLNEAYFEIKNKTFGIIGTGNIGIATAKLALAFGAKVIAYSRTVKNIPGIKYVTLDTLLKEADIISLHCPLNEKTEGLLNQEKLALVKKSAILINTARGAIVDYTALVQALKRGEIAGAALDVYPKEPPLDPDDPLLSAPNLLLTPHIAYATEEALWARARIAIENVEAYLAGERKNVVG